PSYLYILPPSPALRLLPSFPTRRSSDLAALGLLICAMATNLPMLWIGTMLAGLFSVAAQILIPLATMAVKPEKTGEVVGFLMSGLLVGILLSTSLSGLLSELFHWKTIYALSSISL